jgi:hypothetical protein
MPGSAKNRAICEAAVLSLIVWILGFWRGTGEAPRALENCHASEIPLT